MSYLSTEIMSQKQKAHKAFLHKKFPEQKVRGFFWVQGPDLIPATFRVAVPKMSCDTHKGCHNILTASPFVLPSPFRRKRSAQNKLFARGLAQETRRFSQAQNFDSCIQQKIPRTFVQGIFLEEPNGLDDVQKYFK